MSTQDIVQKLWNLCNVLRDDGITYHQYVTELTYILFLKMADETGADKDIPEAYRWGSLTSRSGIDLKKHYYTLLSKLGEESVGRVAQIYANASSASRSRKTSKKSSRRSISWTGMRPKRKVWATCMKDSWRKTPMRRSPVPVSTLPLVC